MFHTVSLKGVQSSKTQSSKTRNLLTSTSSKVALQNHSAMPTGLGITHATDSDSDDDVFNGVQSTFNQKRKTCKRKIRDQIQQVAQDIQEVAQLGASAKRVKCGLFSKFECLQEYHAALNTLLHRVGRATTEKEGKDDFRYDIKQIEHDMKVVFAAGWVNIKNVMLFGGFPRITGINGENDQLDASMHSMPSVDPATPRIMRSGRKMFC